MAAIFVMSSVASSTMTSIASSKVDDTNHEILLIQDRKRDKIIFGEQPGNLLLIGVRCVRR